MSAKPFESWIQDLVYNVDVGIGQRFVKLALYILFIVALVVLYQASEFKGLKDPEAMEMAQLGRNLAQRGQFVTQCVRPASMWYLMTHRPGKDPRVDGHPDILHPPFYPFVLATFFKLSGTSFSLENVTGVFPPERWIILPLCHVYSLLTGLFVYLLGGRLFDRRTALLAVTAYLLSNAVWAESISGGPVPLAVFLVTAAFYFAVVGTQKRETATGVISWAVPLALSALCCILAFLTRYGTVVVVPAIALYLGLMNRPRGWVWLVGFLLVFLLGVSPWLARNKAVSGGLLGLAPLTALNESSMFEDNSFERTLAPDLRAGTVSRVLQSKWLKNELAFYEGPLRTLGNGLFICVFLTSFFYRFNRREVHLFRWCAALGLVLLFFLAGYFGEPTLRLLLVFLPLVIIYGTQFFFLLLDRLQFRVRVFDMAVIALFVLLGAGPLIVTLLPPRVGIPYPPYFPPYISHVSGLLEPDELMCTDMPWATAWYGQRNSLLLPVTLEEFYRVNDYQKRISGLYFTTITRNKPYARTLSTGLYRTWFPILEGRIPADFPLTQGFPINNLDQLFLTDRVRWGR